MNQEIKWLELILSIILASFGGIVKRLVEIENNPRKRLKPAMYVISAIISLFVGIFTYAACQWRVAEFWPTIMITAGAGFFGTPVIYLIFSFATKKQMGIDLTQNGKDGEQK